MRKQLSIILFLLVSLINIGLFVRYADGLRISPEQAKAIVDGHGIDFRYRYNEIVVLRKGVNPFYLWDGSMRLPPYHPNNRGDLRSEELYEPINAYPPWEYIFMMPFSFLPRAVAWPLWYGIMFASLCAMALFGFWRGRAIRGDVFDGLLAAAIAQMISFPIYYDVHCGNFPLVIGAALALMVWALNRRHDALAGICFSFAMIKPQMSILLAIPLLVHRKFGVVAIAAGICLALALIVSGMCHTNVAELILQGPRASAFAFEGNAIFPGFLLRGHEDRIPTAFVGGLIFGVITSIWISWRMRKESDWLTILAPIAAISVSWTYAQQYNFAILWMLMLTLGLWAMRTGTRRATVLSVLGILILSGATCVVGKGIDVLMCHGWQNVEFLGYGCDIWRMLVAAVAILCAVFYRNLNRDGYRSSAGVGSCCAFDEFEC